MSWLLPSALGIAATAAVAAVVLHFIARGRPASESLPTARFIPQRPVRARARSIALSDVLLLLVRIAAVLALGAAVAGPVFAAARGGVRRIVVLDRSRDVADVREAIDSVRALFREGDAVVVFDSAAARLSGADALDSVRGVDVPGSLSAGLAMALRVAGQLSPHADSIELIVASPTSVEEMDGATLALRAQWPGRIRLVPLRAAGADERMPRVEAASGASDPVIAGLSLMSVVGTHGDVRVVRGHPAASDTAWASDSGHVLVVWPASDGDADWPRRPTIDAIGGVTSSSGTMIGRFPRLWMLGGNAIARWADGEPAATEHTVGRGCIRDVGIVLDAAGDVTLRAPFRRFAGRLLERCGGNRRTGRVDSATIASLGGGASIASLAAAGALQSRASQASPWTRWLLGLGAALLLIELVARRMDRRAA